MSEAAPVLLQVKDLTIRYRTPDTAFDAVEDVTFDVAAGEGLGIVGESGCGKSTLARGLLRLLPPAGEITAGEILFRGRNILDLTSEELRRLRWRHVSMVFQSSMNALNPVYRIGNQIIEAIRLHTESSRREADDRVAELLSMVGIPPERMHDYPHQFSGGMRQRVCIAMALALEPEFIIADEPTTALDVITQYQILDELIEMKGRLQCSLMFITHDIGVVAKVTDRVAVMYAGKVMELGPTKQVFSRPAHPYTMGLRNAFPSLSNDRELVSIPGSVPGSMGRRTGCRFEARCPFAEDRCRQEVPALHDLGGGHLVACHFPDRVDEFRLAAARSETWAETSRVATEPTREAERAS